MKKLMLGACAIASAVILSGCASSIPMGGIITDVKMPVAAGGDKMPAQLKRGESMCKSYVGMVATGDASIQAALRDSGIKTIYYVDWEAFNVLGIYGEYKCVVHGE
jgi:hypothetical protein